MEVHREDADLIEPQNMAAVVKRGRPRKLTKRVVKKAKNPICWTPVIVKRPQLLKIHQKHELNYFAGDCLH